MRTVEVVCDHCGTRTLELDMEYLRRFVDLKDALEAQRWMVVSIVDKGGKVNTLDYCPYCCVDR